MALSRRRKQLPGLALASAAAIAIAAVSTPAALASPFVTVRMLTDTGQASAVVKVGQVVNYKLTVELGAPSVHNTTSSDPFDLTSIDPTTDGINAARFSIYQLAADGVQANFTTAPTLAAGWNSGPSVNPGTLVARGATGSNDIADLTAMGDVGQYAGRGTGMVNGTGAPVEMTIATGSFVVTKVSANGVQGGLDMTDQASASIGANSTFMGGPAGDFRYHTTFASSSMLYTQESLPEDEDPMYGFVGLSLTGSIPGDVNGDGKVTLADYNAVINNFGTRQTPYTNGDSNGDGQVTLADYNDVINDFGYGTAPNVVVGAAAFRAAIAAVPEPSAVAVLGAGALVALRRRRNRP